MALKGSRRIPKAYQRRSSALSKRVARKHTRRKRRGMDFHFTKLSRQWKRFSRHMRVPMRSVKMWILLASSSAVLLALLYFLFSPQFAISSMRVSREDRRVDVEEVQNLLSPFFGRHILFVSPLLLSHKLHTAYPEITRADVRRKFPDELGITIFVDPIAADVLIGEPDHTEAHFGEVAERLELETREDPYSYLTERGVYLEYPFVLTEEASRVPLRLHLVDWAVKPTHRQKLLTEDVLREMLSVKRILEQSFGHSVPYVTFYVRAREFHVQTEELALWFDLATPAVQQINRYRDFLQTIRPDAAKSYVDLRLHDRVVYR